MVFKSSFDSNSSFENLSSFSLLPSSCFLRGFFPSVYLHLPLSCLATLNARSNPKILHTVYTLTNAVIVSLKLVQQSNAALRSTISSQVSLFIGATNGLALATLTKYTRHSMKPKVYIVGRNPSKLSSIISDLEEINPKGVSIPIKSEISLFKNVDTACEELKRVEKSLDLLLMCPGYLKPGRVPGMIYP